MQKLQQWLTSSISAYPGSWLTWVSIAGLILTLITTTAIITAYTFKNDNLAALQQAQRELEAATGPKLSYTVVQFGGRDDDADLETARRELENKIIDTALSYVQNNPGVDYAEALDEVLPLQIAVPFNPIGVCVIVENSGGSTAHRVRFTVGLRTRIGNILTPESQVGRLLNFEQGDETVIYELDRLTAGTSAQLMVLFEGPIDNPGSVLAAYRDADTLSQDGTYFLPFTIYESARKELAPQGTSGPAPTPHPGVFVSHPIQFRLIQFLGTFPTEITVASDEVNGSPGPVDIVCNPRR
jgi:hypothetical protein